ncbi:hypothetical protein [Variovorax boronicumulans]|uniref:hypothetical protein n=1 Tax=Variovorax boronicumulans TaxID=436515 RepID=UPI001C57BC68
MTSVVDTSVKLFLDTMANAPVLTKQPGSLVALLDACLVLGFDAKTATSLTVADGVATLQHPGTHAAVPDSVILVSGVTGALTALNGEQKIVSKATGSLTFATAAPNGTAAGTVVFKMAPAGWEIVYTAPDVRVYRSLDPTSSKMLLKVDDTGSNNQPGHCRIRAYETMSDINTGTGMFPLDSEFAGTDNPMDGRGGYWAKGYAPTAGTLPIPWSVFADSRLFYYAPTPYAAESTSYSNRVQGNLYGFGDMKSRRLSGDPYAVALAGGRMMSDAQSYHEQGVFNHSQSDYSRIWIARDYTGLGQSQVVRSMAYGYSGTGFSGATLDPFGSFPSKYDGSLLYCGRYLRKQSILDNTDYAPRCDVPGVYHILQGTVYPQLGRGTRVPGSGPVLGRTLYAQMGASSTTDPTSSPTSVSVFLMDVTGPWR